MSPIHAYHVGYNSDWREMLEQVASFAADLSIGCVSGEQDVVGKVWRLNPDGEHELWQSVRCSGSAAQPTT